MNRVLAGKNELERLYWQERKSLLEIASIYRVSIPAVRMKMKKLGVSRRNGSDAQLLKYTDAITKDILVDLYVNQGLSQKKIAAQFGLSQGTIGMKLVRFGISCRTRANKGVKNGMYGRAHTIEAREKIRSATQKHYSNPENRERNAILTAQQIVDGRTGKSHNRLETRLATILDRMGVEYVWQYRIGRFVFDFFIPSTRLLIEVHGTFWHADPRFYKSRKLTPIQQRNIDNDGRKALQALNDGYQLTVLWEYDINRIAI